MPAPPQIHTGGRERRGSSHCRAAGGWRRGAGWALLPLRPCTQPGIAPRSLHAGGDPGHRAPAGLHCQPGPCHWAPTVPLWFPRDTPAYPLGSPGTARWQVLAWVFWDRRMRDASLWMASSGRVNRRYLVSLSLQGPMGGQGSAPQVSPPEPGVSPWHAQPLLSRTGTKFVTGHLWLALPGGLPSWHLGRGFPRRCRSPANFSVGTEDGSWGEQDGNSASPPLRCRGGQEPSGAPPVGAPPSGCSEGEISCLPMTLALGSSPSLSRVQTPCPDQRRRPCPPCLPVAGRSPGAPWGGSVPQQAGPSSWPARLAPGWE